MAVRIGVDVGGTKILAGLVDHTGAIIDSRRAATTTMDAPACIGQITQMVTELAAATTQPVIGLGIGVAALVDVDRRTVIFAPNLGWGRVDLAGILESTTGIPTLVDNDANAAAWGEFAHGAARGWDDVVMVTVGTGVGGGLVLGGRVHRGAAGLAGEIGHLQVVPGGRECPCGSRGCWEQYASGSALLRRAREWVTEGGDRARVLREMAGGDPQALTGPQVTEAARRGDPAALEVYAEIGGWLGVGLADLTAVLDPPAFVVGGGVGEAGELLLAPARRRLAEIVGGYGGRPVPQVVGAVLGNDAGVIGAATP